ncbi:MAG: hypothetical protein E7478_10690 [Ruminococcaceae bacterium]|nr:hypothetical protein [Oscillospiraceae bacterium]
MVDVMGTLERARLYELEISAQLEHIERLHRIAAKARESNTYSQNLADKLALLESELNEHIDRTVDAKLAALEYISILSGEERGIIEHYYLLGYNWDKIAIKMYMSERRVFLLRKTAIAKLKNYYEPDTGRRDHGNRKKDKDAAGACKYYSGGACTADRCNSVGCGQL